MMGNGLLTARAVVAICAFMLVTTADADIVGASFKGFIGNIHENNAGLRVADGDLLHGHLVIDTTKATRQNPGAAYADYLVTEGALLSIYVAGKELGRAIDFINITNDRFAYTSDSVVYWDMFFVSGGDFSTAPDNAIQFKLQEQRAFSLGSPITLPTLMTSDQIPSPLDLDLSVVNEKGCAVHFPEIRFNVLVASFAAFDPPRMLDELQISARDAGLSRGLVKKTDLAQTYYDNGDVQAACAFLGSFADGVRSLINTKKPRLGTEVASQLMGDAGAIESAIGCM